MKRLAILDDVRLTLQPVNLRLWLTAIICLVCGVVLATSYGAWLVVRNDYQEFSSMLTQAIAQRDNLARVCIIADDAAKRQVARKTRGLGIGGESR